jgi:gluconolactonase
MGMGVRISRGCLACEFSSFPWVCYCWEALWTASYDLRCSYAFDGIRRSGQPFLTGRRLFAMADKGAPDGIKCDLQGNVYSGCGDGVNVWSPGGVLLGRILVDGGVANFCFGKKGEIFLLNETKLWRAQLAEHTMGALLKI